MKTNPDGSISLFAEDLPNLKVLHPSQVGFQTIHIEQSGDTSELNKYGIVTSHADGSADVVLDPTRYSIPDTVMRKFGRKPQ